MATTLVDAAVSQDSVADKHQDAVQDFSLETAGCCFERAAKHVVKYRANPDAGILSCFEAYCASPEFVESVKNFGLQTPDFTPSNLACPGNAAFDKFANACQGLAPSSRLAVVFHGTRKGNIPDILRNGLDPSKRKGQAYGPGEYFSKEPGVSVSYCGGGEKMLVFVVVVPVPAENCPPDYVVVNNNDHQVPLGVLSFKGVDHSVLKRSHGMKQKLRRLTMEVFKKSQEADEAMAKATIIQLLFKERVDIASEKYQKEMNGLTHISKREISMYVHNLLDEDLVDFYFPGLPKPMLAKERDTATIKSVDQTQKEVSKAKEELAKESSNFANGVTDSAVAANTKANIKLAMKQTREAARSATAAAGQSHPPPPIAASSMLANSNASLANAIAETNAQMMAAASLLQHPYPNLLPPVDSPPFSAEDDLTLWNGHEWLGDRWDKISTISFRDSRSADSLKDRWHCPAFKNFITKRFGSNAFDEGSPGDAKNVTSSKVEL